MKSALKWMPVAAVLAAAPFIASPTRADTPESIAANAGCSACHARDQKILGPAYRDIAAKYKADPKAAAALAAKVRAGGKGVWGAIPMPPADTQTISDPDLHAVIAWILKP
jgi:cytochrome c